MFSPVLPTQSSGDEPANSPRQFPVSCQVPVSRCNSPRPKPAKNKIRRSPPIQKGRRRSWEYLPYPLQLAILHPSEFDRYPLCPTILDQIKTIDQKWFDDRNIGFLEDKHAAGEEIDLKPVTVQLPSETMMQVQSPIETWMEMSPPDQSMLLSHPPLQVLHAPSPPIVTTAQQPMPPAHRMQPQQQLHSQQQPQQYAILMPASPSSLSPGDRTAYNRQLEIQREDQRREQTLALYNRRLEMGKEQQQQQEQTQAVLRQQQIEQQREPRQAMPKHNQFAYLQPSHDNTQGRSTYLQAHVNYQAPTAPMIPKRAAMEVEEPEMSPNKKTRKEH